MRIVGGRLGGRRFEGPPGKVTRPTPERAREGLASALHARGAIEGASVLDLFTGTGALGFEALSRGAIRALLIDNDPQVVRTAARSARILGLQERVQVWRLDLIGNPAAAASRIARNPAAPFDLVFADPPYRVAAQIPRLIEELLERGCLSGRALVAMEYALAQPPDYPTGFTRLGDYRYGDTAVLLFGVS